MAQRCDVSITPAQRDLVAQVNRKWATLSRLNPRSKNVYVGLLSKIPRPQNQQKRIETTWGEVSKGALDAHTERINNEISFHCRTRRTSTKDSIILPELILTGETSSFNSATLNLRPNIWFRCGSNWVEDIVRHEVDPITWTVHYDLGDKIRTGLRSAVPAVDPTLSLPRYLSLDGGGFELPDGRTLFLNMERPAAVAKASACGLLCSVAIKRAGKLLYHGSCRIGGVLSIKDGSGEVKLVGITSGHALLDEVLTAHLDLQPSDHRPDSAISRGRRRLRGLLSYGERSGATVEAPPAEAKKRLIDSEKLDQAQWHPIRSVYSINWLGGGWESAAAFQFPFFVSQPDRLAPDADFALLEIPRDLKDSSQILVNSFRVRGEDHQNVTGIQFLEGALTDDCLYVVLDSDTAVPATLLPERPHLYLRGRLFPTRKIQMDHPLGKFWTHRACNLHVSRLTEGT